jgi:hypothetical protein
VNCQHASNNAPQRNTDAPIVCLRKKRNKGIGPKISLKNKSTSVPKKIAKKNYWGAGATNSRPMSVVMLPA